LLAEMESDRIKRLIPPSVFVGKALGGFVGLALRLIVVILRAFPLKHLILKSRVQLGSVRFSNFSGYFITPDISVSYPITPICEQISAGRSAGHALPRVLGSPPSSGV
jgi:hypothetical protein